MYCRNCQQQIPDQGGICPSCGTENPPLVRAWQNNPQQTPQSQIPQQPAYPPQQQKIPRSQQKKQGKLVWIIAIAAVIVALAAVGVLVYQNFFAGNRNGDTQLSGQTELTTPSATDPITETKTTTVSETQDNVSSVPEEPVETAPTEPPTEPPAEVSVHRVALITDVTDIDEGTIDRAIWEGVLLKCEDLGWDYTYYVPYGDSVNSRVAAIEQAIDDGYDVILMSGYLFGEPLVTVQDQYPGVYFLGIDISEMDLTYDYETYYVPAGNTQCVVFAEEQAGYLAGYAAVADGYRNLGFLGGMEVPAVMRYGYGFVQGANAAANDLGIADQVSVKYTYGGQYFGDAAITAKMDDWYASGTEVVFACGGGIYVSVVEAAETYGGMAIGLDVDQSGISDRFLTSAFKDFGLAAEVMLEELAYGNWQGRQIRMLSLQGGDFVGLPTASHAWRFSSFTQDAYRKVQRELGNGTRVCSNETEYPPAVSIRVDYIQ